jgi:sugar (pentulose or hexulose) kinase
MSYLGANIGTSGCKATLFGAEGALLCDERFAAYRELYPTIRSMVNLQSPHGSEMDRPC